MQGWCYRYLFAELATTSSALVHAFRSLTFPIPSTLTIQQVQSTLADDANKTEWNKHIARLTGFAQETALGFASRYNETVWFPVARNAATYYMEVRVIRGITNQFASYMCEGHRVVDFVRDKLGVSGYRSTLSTRKGVVDGQVCTDCPDGTFSSGVHPRESRNALAPRLVASEPL